MVTLAALSFMDLESQAASLITLVLSGALLVTAGALIFRSAIVSFHRRRFQMLDTRHTAIVTVIVGAILGMLVAVSSVASPPLSAVLVRRGTPHSVPTISRWHPLPADCWLYYVLAALAGGTYSAERPSRQHD